MIKAMRKNIIVSLLNSNIYLVVASQAADKEGRE